MLLQTAGGELPPQGNAETSEGTEPREHCSPCRQSWDVAGSASWLLAWLRLWSCLPVAPGAGGREAGDTWQETGSPCWGRRRPQTPNQCSLLSLLGAGSRASGALCFLPGEGSVPSHHGRTCHYRKDGHGSIKAVTLFRS